MGLRLSILSMWTPKFIIRRELENISDKTITALRSLLSKDATKAFDASNQDKPSPTTICDQRATMARTQARLVESLASAVGHEEAVRLGRETLFLVGQNLGRQARSRLGVGDNSNDLAKAAKILYRVLGIEFHLQWHGQSTATVVIDKCALAKQYSKLACEVLSATDEGVMRGLQPKLTMKFKEFMTSGCKNCLAEISFNGKEAFV